ncbi:hypothetical protein [Pseudomonas sp. zfem003]|uniref:DUF4376 domain-containing protein n=1 Tax=Pseudomonas sp. zfem003 TaxID=3078198 RepID=UPI0029285226|nr:hypothetical protein [Pseudomonas sp. zfem003]MDU9400191.1 hypothetical protein [Pseudomonas sp. zfem003]
MPFFDPVHSGFYSEDRNDIPKGAVRISEELRTELIKTGLPIALNSDGIPTPIYPSEPSAAERLKSRHGVKTKEVDTACESAIISGFQSAALGTPHRYSSQLDDQLNLTGAILRGLDMPYACRDEQGVRDFRLHTAEQLRQVGDDFTLYKLQLLQRANALKQQLDLALAAGDIEAMQAITWEAAAS